MNPYTQRLLALLGDRQPVDVLAKTPSHLEDFFWDLKDSGLNRSYGEGKWTARQIFAHLTDAEIALGFRVRQVLAEDDHHIQAFDPDVWMALHGGIDAVLAIETFRATRLWNLTLYRTLTPAQWDRRAIHPERGEETLNLIVKLIAAHDLNHLAQLTQIASAKSP